CPQVRVLTLQALELVGDLDPVVVLPPSRRPYERRHNATLRPNRTFRRSHPFSKNFEKSAAVDSRRRGERLLDRRPRGGLSPSPRSPAPLGSRRYADRTRFFGGTITFKVGAALPLTR